MSALGPTPPGFARARLLLPIAEGKRGVERLSADILAAANKESAKLTERATIIAEYAK